MGVCSFDVGCGLGSGLGLGVDFKGLGGWVVMVEFAWVVVS